ncbi:hypothetical protein EZS27_015208 [termite gut metagenome]|uniref:Dynamin N-terminal domain-containing protein n=1 Tax=termite gut metagenome TaxID=433724 RepID=A0A5J4RTA2_9ZZZZ
MLPFNYKHYKENAKDIFEEYCKFKGVVYDKLPNIKSLEGKIAQLKNNKFLLAVAGQVKAGKSTFINAFLGEEILPTGPLQCTSSVIEIYKSDDKVLNITYGSERKENFTGEGLGDKIKSLCSINEKYMDIPFVEINKMVLEKKEGNVDIEEIMGSLREKEKWIPLREKIQDYIANVSCDTIPVKVEIGYPLKIEFDDLRIVDTPGVGAIGGLGDLSFDYLEKANAVLFVHSLTSPIELESFSTFIDNTIPERNRESLFLVLTQANVKPNEKERKYKEAVRQFQSRINEEKIVAVDSMLQLIKCDLDNGSKLAEIEQDGTKDDALAHISKMASRGNLSWNEDTARCLLNEISGFEKMINLLEEFAKEAPKLQLHDILKLIRDGYEILNADINDAIQRKQEQKEDPQTFELTIKKIQKGLTDFQLHTKQNSDKIVGKYQGSENEVKNEIERIATKYTKEVDSYITFDQIRKGWADYENELQDYIKEFSSKVKNDFEEILQPESKTLKNQGVTPPSIDIDYIETQAKKNAWIRHESVEYDKNDGFFESVKRGIGKLFGREEWGQTKRTIQKEEYSEEAALKEFKINIRKGIDKVKYHLQGTNEEKDKFKESVFQYKEEKSMFKELVSQYKNSFDEEVEQVILERMSELEIEKNKKKENNELIEEIEKLKLKTIDLDKQQKLVKSILNDL